MRTEAAKSSCISRRYLSRSRSQAGNRQSLGREGASHALFPCHHYHPADGSVNGRGAVSAALVFVALQATIDLLPSTQAVDVDRAPHLMSWPATLLQIGEAGRESRRHDDPARPLCRVSSTVRATAATTPGDCARKE